MKSNKFWIILFGLLLIAALIAALLLPKLYGGGTALVRQNGELIAELDLSEPRSLVVTGAVTNTVVVENGEIRVSQADCPDQICVRHSPISSGGDPIVCLPNGLVITIEGGEIDAVG